MKTWHDWLGLRLMGVLVLPFTTNLIVQIRSLALKLSQFLHAIFMSMPSSPYLHITINSGRHGAVPVIYGVMCTNQSPASFSPNL